MKTVLVIDDDHDVRVALRDVFEEAGLHVCSAANGREGLALFKSLCRPLVVILDQNMPIMNGDEFLKGRLAHPELMDVPVIVVSAMNDRGSLLGATEFLRKPLDLPRLLQRVNHYLARQGNPSPSATPEESESGGSASASTSPHPSRRA